MSDQINREIRDFSKYDAMETAELEEILRLDAEAPEGEESDTDQILYIMGILARRRKQSDGKTAQEAYESFLMHYLPGEEGMLTRFRRMKPRRAAVSQLRRLAAVAAVLVIVILGTVSVKVRSAEIWRVTPKWTRGSFWLDVEGMPSAQPTGSGETECYTSLQDAVDQVLDPSVRVPTWIPEGYELGEIKVYTDIFYYCEANYWNGDKLLQIMVRGYLENSEVTYLQGGGMVGCYRTRGIDHYLFYNRETLVAVWMDGQYICDISGEISPEEMKAMIASIEREE